MGKTETPLSVNQQKELLDSLIETLEQTDLNDESELQEYISEAADSFVPVYYTDQVSEWQAMGCPEGHQDNDQVDGSGIFDLIAKAIYHEASDYLYGVTAGSDNYDVLTDLRAERAVYGINEGYINLAHAILK